MSLPPPAAGSTALVTGASSGIGAAIARELAGRGYAVTLVARREERLRELAAELADGHGVRADAIAADIGSRTGRDELARAIGSLGLEVEVLVNNAGFGGAGNFAEFDRGRQVEMVALNCEALLDLQARYLAPMIGRGKGAVINIASTASFQPMPGTAAYAATKAFVLSLSEGVHSELQGTGVTLTVVCPGPVRTEFTEAAGIAGAEERLPGFFWLDAETVAREALDGVARGKRVIVPGALNRAGALTGQHTPRALSLPVVKHAWRRGAL